MILRYHTCLASRVTDVTRKGDHRAPRRNSNVARNIGRRALASDAAILAAVRAEEAVTQEAARINDAVMQKAAMCRAYGLWGEIE